MIDGFHRALKAELELLSHRRQAEIINLSGDSVEQIALSHRYSVGYLRALNDVVDLCEQVEDRLYRKNQKDVA